MLAVDVDNALRSRWASSHVTAYSCRLRLSSFWEPGGTGLGRALRPEFDRHPDVGHRLSTQHSSRQPARLFCDGHPCRVVCASWRGRHELAPVLDDRRAWRLHDLLGICARYCHTLRVQRAWIGGTLCSGIGARVARGAWCGIGARPRDRMIKSSTMIPRRHRCGRQQ